MRMASHVMSYRNKNIVPARMLQQRKPMCRLVEAQNRVIPAVLRKCVTRRARGESIYVEQPPDTV